VLSIHRQAADLQGMIGEMKAGIVAFEGQTDVSLEKLKGKELRRSRLNALKNYDAEEAFVHEAKAFEATLENMLLDPVIRNQIRDHLDFTGEPDMVEPGIRYHPGEPLIKFYHELTDASMGIALTEYVAIEYILQH